jgi:hypothetical protein
MADDPILAALLGRLRGRRTVEPAPPPVLPTATVRRPSRRVLGGGHIRSSPRGAVYDSPRVGRSGKRPTHLISTITSWPATRGMTIDEYEERALGRRDFPPNVNQAINSLDYLDPDVAEDYRRLAAGADSAGIPLSVRETYRPQARQIYLFQQGRSRPGPEVTWTLTSNHRDNRALDLGTTPSGYRWLDANAGRYGFNRLAGDAPHIEKPPVVDEIARAMAPVRQPRKRER